MMLTQWELTLHSKNVLNANDRLAYAHETKAQHIKSLELLSYVPFKSSPWRSGGVIDRDVRSWEECANSGLNSCCILEGGKNGGVVNLRRSVRAYAKSLRNCKV